MADNSSMVALLPRPKHIHVCEGTFVLTDDTIIRNDAATQSLATDVGAEMGLRIDNNDRKSTSTITLAIDSELAHLGDEGYRLAVTPQAITLSASHIAGLFYATRTLLQLAHHAQKIPCVEIIDQPRFPWRGVMLDVARYFFTIDFIKHIIDRLADYKMNRLHLHLTDAQAWRLEITKYPKLTEPLDRKYFPATHEGFYPQSDIRDLVAYAKHRQVMIVPEIEFPGHSDAVLTAYPELLCANHASHTGGWDHKEYCTASDRVIAFANDVFDEVASLFDSPFIHIGGDEYHGSAWAACPDCQKQSQQQGLESDDAELAERFAHCLGSPTKYRYYRGFMRRIAALVVQHDRVPVLWDDISWQGRYPDHSVVIQWHYRNLFDYAHKTNTLINPALDAAINNHDAIVAPASHLYFDYFDGDALTQRLYQFEPIPDDAPSHTQHHFVGVQSCLWEQPQREVEHMLFPRLLAVAETGWTDRSLRCWSDFAPRLAVHRDRLRECGVQCAATPDTEAIAKTGVSATWTFPAMSGWLKDWLINDALFAPGTRDVCIALPPHVTLTSAFITIDGYEQPLPSMATADRSCTIPATPAHPIVLSYRFALPTINDDTLYSLRFYFHTDRPAETAIKATLSAPIALAPPESACAK